MTYNVWRHNRRKREKVADAGACPAVQRDRTSFGDKPITRHCELPRGHAEAHLSASGIRWPITPIPSE